MIRFSYKKGLRFLEGLKSWTVVRRLVSGKIQLENDEGELKNLEFKELNSLWMKGGMTIDEKSLGTASNVFYMATPRDLESFAAKDQKLARYRYAYLSRLEKLENGFVSTPGKLQPILDQIAVDLKHENAPRAHTVYSWWVKYRFTKCITKLTDGRCRSGRKKYGTFFGIFEEALYEVYLTLQKKQGKAVVEAMTLKIARTNMGLSNGEKLVCPGRATIYRWLKDLQQDLVTRARLGKVASEKEFRTVLKKFKVKKILERLEIDHTPLDLIVVDSITMLPLGRPWLTLAIDRASRMIMGFYICFHAPSAFSVLQCLKRSILPKDVWLARFPDIKGSWPARGIPELIACDNGMDLHADAFEDICLEMGIELLYCPAGKAELKGPIERMFRTMNTGLIHGLPGTVFSNIHQRGDYPAEDLAAIDMETLVHLLTKWIVEVYLLTDHRELQMAPLTKWLEGEKDRILEMPAYPQQLEVLVGIPTSRTLFHYGVELDYLRYNCPELQLFRARSGGTPIVNLKYYEDDVGYVHIFDDVNQEYIRVKAVDDEYANGLTRHMHLLIREYTKKTYGERWSDEQLFTSKAEIQAIVSAAVLSKKMSTRKKSAAVLMRDSEDIISPPEGLFRALEPDNNPNAIAADIDESLVEEDLPDFGVSTGVYLQKVKK